MEKTQGDLKENGKSTAWRIVALSLIILVAFALRYKGIGYEMYHNFPDEGHVIALSAHLGSGDLNPHWFLYPTFYLYFVAVVMGVYFVAGRVLGFFGSVAEFKYFYFTHTHTFIFLVRFVTVLLALVHIWLVWVLSRILGRERWGVPAALFLAVSTLHMTMSFTVKPDIMMLMLLLPAVIYAVKISSDPRVSNYALAGLFAGLAASTKYPAAPVVVSIFVGHLYACRGAGARWYAYVLGPKLLLSALVTFIAFFAGSPYFFLDWKTAMAGIEFQSSHMNTPFTNWTGPSAWYHLTVSFRYGLGTVVEVMGLAGIVLMLVRRRREDVTALAFPIVYFIFMGVSPMALTRYVLPVLPFLCIYGAGFMLECFDMIRGDGAARFRRGAAYAFLTAAIAASVSMQLYRDFHFIEMLSKPDTRVTATEWIKKNIPINSNLYMLPCEFYPTQNRKQLQDMVDFRESRRESHVRESTLLGNPNYPGTPAYYVTFLINSRMLNLEEGDSDNLPPGNCAKLPDDGQWKPSDYVLMCRDEKTRYVENYLDSQMVLNVEKHGKLIAEFKPYNTAVGPEAISDKMDDLFRPVANVDGMEYLGPSIWIYKMGQ